MTPITSILQAVGQGDRRAASELLPLVYDELRRLAARKLAQEKPGHTLCATALVHEAYLRLVKKANEPCWDHRGHFFAAAAEAMRRILVESARRKLTHRHGGGLNRVELEDYAVEGIHTPEQMLAFDEALTKLGEEDAVAAQVTRLRLYAGVSVEEAANALGISRASAYREWTYARAWLRCALGEKGD